jgi:hypothetical protein
MLCLHLLGQPDASSRFREHGLKEPSLEALVGNFMGLASLGVDIDISGDLLYSVLLLDVMLGLDFSGLALC